VIVTVTPSPSLDLTYVLPTALNPAAPVSPPPTPTSEVHRARSSFIEASGKGVNVSRTLARTGLSTLAVLPVAGATGRQLLDLLDADAVPHRAVEQSGMTRVNTSIVQPGHLTKVNAPAPPATTAETDLLVASAAAALAHAREADAGGAHWLAVCGALAGGRAEDVLRRLVAVAHAAGARCAVDTSSGALAAAVRAGADLLSPNLGELSDLVGPDAALAGDDVDAGLVADVAAGVARDTGGQLIVSLGARGAVWTDGVEALHAAGPPVDPVNTAGAGDALLAGWLAGPVGSVGGPSSPESGEAGEQRLARGGAGGAAACLSPGTVAGAALLRAADVHGVGAVTVKTLDLKPAAPPT
jgi:1-phosphofructokinase